MGSATQDGQAVGSEREVTGRAHKCWTLSQIHGRGHRPLVRFILRFSFECGLWPHAKLNLGAAARAGLASGRPGDPKQLRMQRILMFDTPTESCARPHGTVGRF